MPPELVALWNFIQGGGGSLALAIFIIAGFLRGWLIPGFIYRAALKRIDRLTDVTEGNAASMDRLSTSLNASVDRLTDELRATRRRD